MVHNMVWGILTVMVLSFIMTLISYGKEAFSKNGLLFMLIWPGFFSSIGCFISATLAILFYLFAQHLIYWQTIMLLISTCSLSKALIDSNCPDLNTVLYICLCFFPGLLVTCIFICFPYLWIKIALAALAFAIFLGNLYYANNKDWNEVFSSKNYRYLEDCIHEYLFPIPLFVFFVVSIM